MSTLLIQKFIRRTCQAACVGKANLLLQLGLMGQDISVSRRRSRLR